MLQMINSFTHFLAPDLECYNIFYDTITDLL